MSTGHDPSVTDYVLETPAMCLQRGATINEKTLVDLADLPYAKTKSWYTPISSTIPPSLADVLDLLMHELTGLRRRGFPLSFVFRARASVFLSGMVTSPLL